MPDLIRRDEVIDELSDRIFRAVWEINELKEKGAEWTDAIKTWQAIIAEDESILEYVKNSIETYDTTIVRCKDCKYFLVDKDSDDCGRPFYSYSCKLHKLGFVFPDRNCIDAERRTDE